MRGDQHQSVSPNTRGAIADPHSEPSEIHLGLIRQRSVNIIEISDQEVVAETVVIGHSNR
jgi:hypothetical protein